MGEAMDLKLHGNGGGNRLQCSDVALALYRTAIYFKSQMASPQRKLSDADYARLANFRYALRRFLEFSGDAARSEGLTPRQHQAMLVIRGSEGGSASIGRLAERLCLKPNTAAELTKRLESGGWITRRADAADRRVVVLELTRSGKRTLEKLSHAHRRELRQIGPEITSLFASLVEDDKD